MLRRLFGLRAGGTYQRGIAAYNEGDLETALALFEERLSGTPDESEPEVALARFYRAEAHARIGMRALEHADPKTALVHFDASLIGHSGYPDRHLRRGVALLFQGDALAAESAARRALEGNENFVEAGALLVLALAEQGQTARAEEERTRWQEKAARRGGTARDLLAGDRLTPDRLRDHLFAEQKRRERIARADGLVHQGFWKEGRAALEELVEEAPDYADIRLRLAVVLALTGEATGAVVHVDHALDRNPRFVDAHHTAAVLALLRSDPRGARRHFDQLRELGGDERVLRYGSALVNALEGDFDTALSELESWAGQEPDIVVLLALLRSVCGQHEAALRGLDALPSRGSSSHLLLDIVSCALAASDIDLARRSVEALPPGGPSPEVAIGRSEVLVRTRKLDRAVDVLEAATADHPRSPALLWALARLHAQRGEFEVAMRRLSSLDALDAQVRGAHLMAAGILRRRGEPEAALTALDQESPGLDGATALEHVHCLRALGRVDEAEALVARQMAITPLDPVWRLQRFSSWARPLLPSPSAP